MHHQHHSHGLLDSLFAPFGGIRQHHHRHKHSLFGQHSSLARHPTHGHCHEDREKLCRSAAHEAAKEGGTAKKGFGVILAVMACLAEHHHALSEKCSKTMTAHLMPCVGDMQTHCTNSSDMPSCLDEHAHKFSGSCNKTLSTAMDHPGFVKPKAAPELPKSFEVPIEVKSNPLEMKTELANKEAMSSPSDNTNSKMDDKIAKLAGLFTYKVRVGLSVALAVVGAMCLYSFYVKCQPPKPRQKKFKIDFAEMRLAAEHDNL
jgi:hypothetical protein